MCGKLPNRENRQSLSGYVYPRGWMCLGKLIGKVSDVDDEDAGKRLRYP